MTSFIPFKPNDQLPFSFQATIGGVNLFASVPFNLYANRYYLKLVEGQGSATVYVPLIDSPDDYDINLALPWSPGSLVYRGSSRQFEVT
ncbi:hypothetical protein N5923_21750 [Erwiniaceae bacterium BAC15a-03b]|uniref:Uncharacterized protein n=1 Tax=Winslowiella arboricola TaxID=2978220 RepID=A0A9J6PXA7_9GAMM|nr:hypothetical protein [Winslowiella arboricola]MCU5774728.1 hypothetical protein [Winslowiella arboricola]MCU5780120.1 hypothetical protein [Winslowiella arboricola]